MKQQNQNIVSVIMPTYNTKIEFLKEAIDSILLQTYENFEFIIVDDGSKEENFIWLKNYVQKEKRVCLLRNEFNSGIVFSLNRAIEQASGYLVFRMDADDVADKKRLQKTIDFFDSHPETDIAGTQFIELNGTNKTLYRSFLPCDNVEIKARLLFSPPFCHPSVCFRREWLVNNKYISGEKAEDYYLWAQCALKGAVFANNRKVLLSYRIHKSQITKTGTEALKSSSSSIRKYLLKEVGIILNDDEMTIWNKISDGELIETDELIEADRIMRAVQAQISREYLSDQEVEREFATCFYHECLRAALNGNCNSYVIFRKSGRKLKKGNSLKMLGLFMASALGMRQGKEKKSNSK